MRIIALLVLAVAASACVKDKSSIDEVVGSDNISGYVSLYDDGVGKVDDSGMTVTVEGVTPAVSAVTDAKGYFILPELRYGTYTLVYSKAGYGTYKRHNVDHTVELGGTFITPTPSLGQLAKASVVSASASVVGSEVKLSVSTSPAGSMANTVYLRFFLSKNKEVSSTTYMYHSANYISNMNPFVFTIQKSELESFGYTAGTTVYFRVYADAFWSNDYLNPVTGRLVFPNLNLTTPAPGSFVVP